MAAAGVFTVTLPKLRQSLNVPPEFPELPTQFENWFASRGWRIRAHQSALIAHAARQELVLLVAPTGGGKTLAGFLPSLIELARLPARRASALHTLYISPLKALAVDVARNLEAPVAEMGLDVRVETRTGDTPPSRRQRQKYSPPDILLTTPEQLALLLAAPRAPRDVRRSENRRAGRVARHAQFQARRSAGAGVGALAVAGAEASPRRSVGNGRRSRRRCSVIWCRNPSMAKHLPDWLSDKPAPGREIRISASDAYVPWAGHLARHAMADVMAAIRSCKTALIFVNTRSQAERTFQELWRINEDNLAIALHHGSLAPAQRRKVEAAMARRTICALWSAPRRSISASTGARSTK